MSEVRDTAEGRRLFGHLVATRPLREGRSAAAATAASLGFHGAVLGALVWATLSVGQAKPSAKSEMMALYTPTPEAPPPPVAPPPPPKVAPPQVQAQVAAQVTQPKPVAAPQYKGFQTLTPPAVAPPDIPPPSLSSAVREEDYSGEGVAGGSSKGTAPLAAQHTVTAEDVAAAPTFTPYTVAPRLKNREEVAKALERYYPGMLREAGVGGKVLVWFFIDENGKVKKHQVKESSGHDALDQAALKVAGIMQFSPALNRDQHVPVWVALPVSFSTSSGTN